MCKLTLGYGSPMGMSMGMLICGERELWKEKVGER
jgi:hypothetical protein